MHPHTLRHACGHALAGKGMATRLLQDWLGHRDIHHSLYVPDLGEIFPKVDAVSPKMPEDWRAQLESNQRPLASEANTLSTELRAPSRRVYPAAGGRARSTAGRGG